LIERPPDDGSIRSETYVGVVLTKINSDIECALVGFLKKMENDSVELNFSWNFLGKLF
jgi:hypothetical protein